MGRQEGGVAAASADCAADWGCTAEVGGSPAGSKLPELLGGSAAVRCPAGPDCTAEMGDTAAVDCPAEPDMTASPDWVERVGLNSAERGWVPEGMG